MLNEKVRTGINGLDELLGGGIPKGSTVLITGEAGTGKTTLAVQYIVNGIKMFNEKGLIVVAGEDVETLQKFMLQFGWDLRQFEKEGKLVLIDLTSVKIGIPADVRFTEFQLTTTDIKQLISTIYRAVKQNNIKRVVIDSVPNLVTETSSVEDLRTALLMLCTLLGRIGCTTLITTEIPEGAEKLSTYGMEEFVASGIIKLMFKKEGNRWIRKIQVRKMRGTKHKLEEHVFEIGKEGIKISNK